LSWREVAEVPVAREQYMYVRKTVYIIIHDYTHQICWDGVGMGQFGTVCWENRESTCHMSCQTGRKLIKITDLPFTIAMNTWIEGGAEKVNLT